MSRNGDRIRNYKSFDYISKDDVLSSYKLLDTIDSKTSEFNVTDYIEAFLACQILEKTLPSSDLSEKSKNEYKNKIRSTKAIVSRYFKTTNTENLEERYQETIPIYRKEFWHIFDKFKLYTQICQTNFPQKLLNDVNTLHHILQNKTLVKAYETILKIALSECSKAAEWLITYKMESNNERVQLYFPSELTKSEIEHILLEYIGSKMLYIVILVRSQEVPITLRW